MIRARLALAVLPVVALTLPLSAQAATSGDAFRDTSGDIVVPSLDIVSGTVRLDATGTARTLTMTATMRGDLTGPPADYDLITSTRKGSTCYSLATRVRWNGVTLAQSYQHASTFACAGDVTLSSLTALATEAAQYAVGGDPADASVSGGTVTATVAAPSWLSAGSQASYAVLSHTTVLATSSSVGYAEAHNYDLAGSGRYWRAS